MNLKYLFDSKGVPVMHSRTFYDYISAARAIITKIGHAGDAVVFRVDKSGELPSTVIVTDSIERVNWNADFEFTSEAKVGEIR